LERRSTKLEADARHSPLKSNTRAEEFEMLGKIWVTAQGPDGIRAPMRPDIVISDCISYILDSSPIVTVIVFWDSG
jgi:hypothetical protein